MAAVDECPEMGRPSDAFISASSPRPSPPLKRGGEGARAFWAVVGFREWVGMPMVCSSGCRQKAEADRRTLGRHPLCRRFSESGLHGMFGRFYQRLLSPALASTKTWRRGGHGRTELEGIRTLASGGISEPPYVGCYPYQGALLMFGGGLAKVDSEWVTWADENTGSAAGHGRFRCGRQVNGPQVGKPAIQQTWKSALPRRRCDGLPGFWNSATCRRVPKHRLVCTLQKGAGGLLFHNRAGIAQA